MKIFLVTLFLLISLSVLVQGFEPITASAGVYNAVGTTGVVETVSTTQSVQFSGGTLTGIGGSSSLVFQNGELISGTITSSKNGNSIKIKNNKFTLDEGDSITINDDGSYSVKRAKKIETSSGGQTVSVSGASDGDIDGQGNYHFDRVEDLSHGKFRVINGVNVKFNNGILTAKQAETFLDGNNIASNVNNLEARTGKFSVGEASKVVSGCNSFDNVKDSEFEFIGDDIKAATSSNAALNITDCSYRDIEFESKGNGSSVTIKKDNYEISRGRLKCGSKDSVEAESTANIEVGSDCFTCLTINPAGTYFYSDSDIRKDFNINVPKESVIYRLCLRKNLAQRFDDYNGLVDFVDKKIELNGVVNYLRYPLKNSQISSLLGSFVYKGLKNVNALLSYDKDLLFLNNLNIKNILNNKNQITTTNPNNFYAIEETELEDGKVHRVVDLSLTSKEQLTQDALSSYDSDSLDAGIKIADGVLIQQIDESKVTILPPGHQKIGSFLR